MKMEMSFSRLYSIILIWEYEYKLYYEYCIKVYPMTGQGMREREREREIRK